jgi:hypothetical protein
MILVCVLAYVGAKNLNGSSLWAPAGLILSEPTRLSVRLGRAWVLTEARELPSSLNWDALNLTCWSTTQVHISCNSWCLRPPILLTSEPSIHDRWRRMQIHKDYLQFKSKDVPHPGAGCMDVFMDWLSLFYHITHLNHHITLLNHISSSIVHTKLSFQ